MSSQRFQSAFDVAKLWPTILLLVVSLECHTKIFRFDGEDFLIEKKKKKSDDEMTSLLDSKLNKILTSLGLNWP